MPVLTPDVYDGRYGGVMLTASERKRRAERAAVAKDDRPETPRRQRKRRRHERRDQTDCLARKRILTAAVLVTGGRAYDDGRAVRRALDEVHRSKGIALLFEGGAGGADRLAREWADRNGVPVEEFVADWEEWGKMAGPLRNRHMVEMLATLRGRYELLALVFSGGRGTEHCCGEAAKAGVAVVHVSAAGVTPGRTNASPSRA